MSSNLDLREGTDPKWGQIGRVTTSLGKGTINSPGSQG
jgi:hypothetical protein